MDQLNEVVKYILYRCRENNTPITEIMANFIAQTIFNNRSYPSIQAPKNSISKTSYPSQKWGSSKRQQSRKYSANNPCKWRSYLCRSVAMVRCRLWYRVPRNWNQKADLNPKWSYRFWIVNWWRDEPWGQKRQRLLRTQPALQENI